MPSASPSAERSAPIYHGTLQDAAESVVHVLAVAFAAFSVWLASKPAGQGAPYGFERIAFVSVGFEGAVIVAVAGVIIWTAILKWRHGIVIEQLGLGVLITLGAVIVNGLLGWHLVRTGRNHHSLILVADGKHVLTDSWTSLGAVVGLLLVMLTGWKPFDPLFAIATALNILWTGGGLCIKAAFGLLDVNDLRVEREVEARLEELAGQAGVGFHGVRCRDTGKRLLVSLHLLFRDEMPIGEAHRIATAIEERLAAELGRPAEVTTHLEAVEDHERVHPTQS